MVRKLKAVISAIIAIGAVGIFAASSAFAQSYFHSLDYHARIEQSGPILMQIGAEQGRGGTPATARVFIERIANDKTGGLERFIQIAAVAPFAATDPVYLDEISAGKSWVTGWEVASVAENAIKPADRDAVAFYRMPPRYPQDCMQQAGGTEHVIFTYDVTAEGTVEHILIRDASDGCFALATQRLVSQWRFAPKLLAGEPVAQTGLQTQLTYVLEDE